jgi:hypothetical protein
MICSVNVTEILGTGGSVPQIHVPGGFQGFCKISWHCEYETWKVSSWDILDLASEVKCKFCESSSSRSFFIHILMVLMYYQASGRALPAPGILGNNFWSWTEARCNLGNCEAGNWLWKWFCFIRTRCVILSCQTATHNLNWMSRGVSDVSFSCRSTILIFACTHTSVEILKQLHCSGKR